MRMPALLNTDRLLLAAAAAPRIRMSRAGHVFSYQYKYQEWIACAHSPIRTNRTIIPWHAAE